MSKLLPGSMPIRFNLGDDRLVGDVRRVQLQQLGGVGEEPAGRHGIDLNLRRRLHVDCRIDLDLDRRGRLAPVATAA